MECATVEESLVLVEVEDCTPGALGWLEHFGQAHLRVMLCIKVPGGRPELFMTPRCWTSRMVEDGEDWMVEDGDAPCGANCHLKSPAHTSMERATAEESLVQVEVEDCTPAWLTSPMIDQHRTPVLPRHLG